MINRRTRMTLIVAGLSFLLVNSAQAGWQVWTTTETRRVLREDPAEKPTAVRLACARNEWRGFQILVRSDVPLRGIRIEAGDLVGPGGAVLASSQSRLFRQHQLHLTDPSYRNDSFRPGWYPDALIPAVASRLRASRSAGPASSPCPSTCPPSRRTGSGSTCTCRPARSPANTGAPTGSGRPRANRRKSPWF